MRIAQLTTDSREHFRDYKNPQPYFGAAPEALLQGFSHLSQIEVHVLSCTRVPMQSPEKIAPNTWFHSLYVPKLGWMRTGYLGCSRALRRKLRDIAPDIVHGQGTERDCAISAVRSGFPNVVTIHGNMAELARLYGGPFLSFQWLATKLENSALRRTAGVFCNSEYTEGLVKPRAHRTWRVPNPVREPFFAPTVPTGPAKCRLLNVGLVTPRKRQLDLLTVAEQLHRDGLEFELHFIGEAPPSTSYATQFLERIKPMEAKGFVRYVGTKNVDELVKYFDASSALLHFPAEEAFGLVVAEALARNLKFFGAKLGGIKDIAAHAPGAELFDTEDWSALRQSISRWIKTGAPRPTGAAELMRSRYHPDLIARRHLEIYRDVLSKRS